VRGRVARDSIVDVVTDEVVVSENDLITEEVGRKIEGLGYEKVRVRSPLSCESPRGVCARCYGMDLSRGDGGRGRSRGRYHRRPVDRRTRHAAHDAYVPHRWTASRQITASEIKVKRTGVVRFTKAKIVVNYQGQQVVLDRNGEIILMDKKERELDRYSIPLGAVVLIKDGADVESERGHRALGSAQHADLRRPRRIARYEDIVDGKTMKERARLGRRHPQDDHRTQGRSAPAGADRGRGRHAARLAPSAGAAPTSRCRTARRCRPAVCSPRRRRRSAARRTSPAVCRA
jgi:DNA-directed RNA polymerase subunit beta'